MAIFIMLLGTLVILGFFVLGAIDRSKEQAAMQPRIEPRMQFQQHGHSSNNQLGFNMFGQSPAPVLGQPMPHHAQQHEHMFQAPNLVPQQTIYCPPQSVVQNYGTSIHERFGKSRTEAQRDKQWISPFGEPNGRAEAANERIWF